MFSIRCCENVDDFLVGDYGEVAAFDLIQDAICFLDGCPENIKDIVSSSATSISEYWEKSGCDWDEIDPSDAGGMHVELYGENPNIEETKELILGQWYPYNPMTHCLNTLHCGEPDIKDGSFLNSAEMALIDAYIKNCARN